MSRRRCLTPPVRTFACRDRDRKGKKEKLFRYLWDDFFKGTQFASWENLHARCHVWLGETPKVGNLRVHATTRRVPKKAYAEERPLFIRLSSNSFPPRPLTRSGHGDFHFLTVLFVNVLNPAPPSGSAHGVVYQIWTFSRFPSVRLPVGTDKCCYTLRCATLTPLGKRIIQRAERLADGIFCVSDVPKKGTAITNSAQLLINNFCARRLPNGKGCVTLEGVSLCDSTRGGRYTYCKRSVCGLARSQPKWRYGGFAMNVIA